MNRVSLHGWSAWRSVLICMVTTALFTGCSGVGSGGTGPTTPGGGGNLPAKLINATSCSDLEQRLKTELIKRYKRQNVWYAYSGWVSAAKDLNANITTTAPTSIQATGTTAATATPHSDTNVQEQGVDEGDLVKTDGSYIYLARGSHFIIMKAQPAAQSEIVSDIDIKDYISELYLNGNQVTLVTTTYNYSGQAVPVIGGLTLPGQTITRMYCYDVTNVAMPTVSVRYDFPGAAQGTRRINSSIYLVTNYTIDIPNPVYISNYLAPGSFDQGSLTAASTLATTENIKRINAASLADLLPSYSRTLYNGGIAGTPEVFSAIGCEDVGIPESGNGADLSLVFSIDLSAAVPAVASSAVLSSWSTLYMSPDALYLASSNNWLWITPVAANGIPADNPEPQTALHKFGISAASAKPHYRGSGVVNGWINNQFSMGEYNGYMRIGTTRGGWFGEGLSNQLAILGEQNGALVATGTLTGLAPGERIYAMRFDRTRGYMVTYRTTDPLYTLDLGDPANPRVAGELHVDGFATYLHLLGTNNSRLLTIGRSANSAGQVTGNKLQLFDVTNLAAPQLLGSYELGQGWSSATYDYHAFLYYDALGILAIPYQSSINSTYVSGLNVFSVSNSGITQRGVIPAKTINGYADNVDRSVIIGTDIYAIASRSLTVADVGTLAVEKAIDLPYSTYLLTY